MDLIVRGDLNFGERISEQQIVKYAQVSGEEANQALNTLVQWNVIRKYGRSAYVFRITLDKLEALKN